MRAASPRRRQIGRNAPTVAYKNRRAYYDDGTPLGSEQNDECRIDALAQAWTVISKAAPRERAGQAMETVVRLLRSPQRPRSSAS